jgi:tetratricopeptide (TPR) repeat protein
MRGVASEGVAPWSRRALATLASICFHDTRDHAAARVIYQEYLSRYPASDWAWVAHVRLGQSAAAQGDSESAADAYARAAALAGTPRAAQSLALACAAEVHAELGQVARAREYATHALALWNDAAGEEYYTGSNEAEVAGEESFSRSDPTTIRKVDLIDRVARFTRADGAPAGASLEQGRTLLARGAIDRALPILERALADSRTTPLEPDARRVLHEVRLRQALALADVDRPDRNPDDAMRLLEAIGADAPDAVTTIARVARATMLAQRDGPIGAAADEMRQALETWRARQPLIAPPPVGSLEADVIAIRAEVFRPLGGGVYGNSRWNAFDWPLRLPSFMVVNPDLSVRIGGGPGQRVSVPHAVPGLHSVIYLNDDERVLLARVITALGGRTRGTPASAMQTPNRPAGPALDVMAFWNRSFPMRQGHWRGWVFETYPAITEIAFADAARTSASARVTIGYSGATVLLRKIDGAWRAVGLTGRWIT